MSKSIQIMAIAVAFVAVTLVSGVVYADDKNGKPFEAIWAAIHNLESNSVTDVYTRTTVIDIKSGTFTIEATCDPFHKVLGGGYENLHEFPITVDGPFEDGDEEGWLVVFFASSSDVGREVKVHAICATT